MRSSAPSSVETTNSTRLTRRPVPSTWTVPPVASGTGGSTRSSSEGDSDTGLPPGAVARTDVAGPMLPETPRSRRPGRTTGPPHGDWNGPLPGVRAELAKRGVEGGPRSALGDRHERALGG